MTSPTLAPIADIDTAAIADASTRLVILQRLADLGMRLAEEIVERAVNSPYHPEPKHEPARAFATISRAVRLTLVLQEKMQATLIALRKGEPLVRRAEPLCRKPSAAADRDDSPDDPPEPSDRSHETLRERESERFDELASGPFEDCVAAIRADLGLAPGEDVPAKGESVEAAVRNVLEAASAAPTSHGFAVAAPSTALMRVLTARPLDSG